MPDVLDHQLKRLQPFVGSLRKPMSVVVFYRVEDYPELVDWTGSHIREEKRWSIDGV